MAYQIDTGAISNIAKKDTNRLTGAVAKCLAANSPFIGVLRGGTFASGQGDVVTSAVEMPAAPGDSLAVPTFVNQTAIAGTNGTAEKTGKVDFTYQLQGKRGTGPKVNVKLGFGAFKSSYLTAEDALKKLITQYINADIQAQLVLKSATKITANSAAANLAANIKGGSETDIGNTFQSMTLPNSQLSFKFLHACARHLREALFGEMFPASGKGQAHFRFIGSNDIIEAFRNEIGVEKVLLSLTEGGYKLGEEAVSGYSFETSPAYRGIAFGSTQRPMRFNAIDGGTFLPTWIDPVVNVVDAGTQTAYSKVNPAWLSATYEVGILLAEGTFERQIPEQYVGEGTFKFAPQLHGGELEWHYVKDNDTNTWGDFGWHKYQITRAYKPLRPQHIMVFIYKRASTDLGLTAI
ncbi:MAG TPA: hypothetical protein VEH04_16840 [Verrucomicrobiae bacterium]|nr:hypothetical protein [Verrucomicrobiae bacterium]